MHVFIVLYVAGVVASWAPMPDEQSCQAMARGMTAEAEAMEGASLSIAVNCEDRPDPPVNGEQNV